MRSNTVKTIATAGIAALLGLLTTSALCGTQISFGDVERMVTSGNLTIQANNLLIGGIYSSIDELNKPVDTTTGETVNMLDKFKEATKQIKEAGEKMTDPALVAMKTIYLYSATVGEMTLKSMEAQMPSEDTKKATKATLQKNAMQLQSANLQIVMGAQNLYLGYLQMERQLQEMRANETMLARSIEVLAVTTSAGKTTDLEYETTRAQLDNLAVTMEVLTLEMKNLALDLGNLLGTYGEVVPTGLPEVADFPMPEVAGDLQKALANSYTANGARLDLDSKGKTNPTTAQIRDIEVAKLNLRIAEQNINVGISKLANSVQSKQKQVAIAQKSQEVSLQKLENVKTKYEAGKVSKTDLLTAQTEVQTSKIKLESAKADLISALLKYQWLVRGIASQA